VATMPTSPRIRRALDALPSYKPGRAAVSQDGAPAFKISSNENPYPPLPGVLEAAMKAAGEMNRYPDMFATGLVAALADRFDVPESHVSTGTGSVGVLQQIVQATAVEGDEVVYAWRSFEAYPIVVGISGAASITVPLDADARHDLTALAAAVTARTRLVLICSPNNRVPADVLVVLDEAYCQFVRDPNAADGIRLYRDRPNVCVLRTFSKAYGLAGLRVGFAVAHEPVADAIRKTAVPFGVSSIAQLAAIESLRREAALFERVETLVAERDRVRATLLDQGWEVPVSEANFVWLDLGDAAIEFAAACDEAGVIVRAFPGEGCRVTIAEPEASDLFLRTAAEWRKVRS
jgi:histidinol-phosphate aminotransferase